MKGQESAMDDLEFGQLVKRKLRFMIILSWLGFFFGAFLWILGSGGVGLILTFIALLFRLLWEHGMKIFGLKTSFSKRISERMLILMMMAVFGLLSTCVTAYLTRR